MRLIAINENTDFITFMHNDCEVITEGGDSLLVEAATTAFADTSQKIGWVHQDANENEDLFCAYKTSMLSDVGEWDWLCCPFYFLDIDFMKRVRKRGWTIQKTPGIMCKHHSNASSTIKSDKLRGFINPYYFSVSQNLMDFKWARLDGDWANLN
jgi:GT2 family glycosyltransferase